MQSYFELVTYCVYGVFDDIDKLRFSFKINMLLQEIEIKYRNLKYYASIKGQKYYHKGISLDNEQFEKLKTLLNVDVLTKEYEKSKEDRNMFFTVSDLCESKLKLFGSDIILEINSSDNNPFLSECISNLIQYVVDTFCKVDNSNIVGISTICW